MSLLHYVPLVRAIARKYRWAMGNALALEDLVQAGLMGVVYGQTQFDATRGVPEWGYLHFWARRYIQQEVDTHGSTVQRPRRQPRSAVRLRSLDAPVSLRPGQEGELTLGDMFWAAADSGPEPIWSSAVATLDAAELETVLAVLRGETMTEISERTGLTRQGTHHRLRRAKAKLAEHAR